MQIAKMTICYLKLITHLSNLSINTAIIIADIFIFTKITIPAVKLPSVT